MFREAVVARKDEEVVELAAVHGGCPFLGHISCDFHEDVREHCERCELGSGPCLAELVLSAEKEVTK